MLTTDRIEEVANDVFRTTLSEAGFLRAAVTAAEDDLGERALFVRVRFGRGAGPTPGRVLGVAMSNLRSRLLAVGEDRLPYLDLEYEGDELDMALVDGH